MQTLPESTDELDRDRPLVIHCRSGPRGQHAVSYLRAAGFDNAVNLAGGILEWAEKYDPDMQVY